MTIVFDDEELYTALKVEAARTHRTAKDIVAEALAIHFEATADEHAALLRRSRVKQRANAGGVEQLLAGLGFTRSNAESANLAGDDPQQEARPETIVSTPR